MSQPAWAYLVLSGSLAVAWGILYALRADLRRAMLRVSLGTMPLGLTEPLFVPEYWNPPTLWDLARRTGFDLESLLFSFAIGGIVFAAYDVLVGTAPAAMLPDERHHRRHRLHLLAIASAPLLFLILLALTRLNPIYAAALALVGGFAATVHCRPDLWRKMLLSGALFLVLYFIVFSLFDTAIPGYVAAVWNIGALSGVFLFGVPAEELMFAFTFGLYWSSVYEHFTWRRERPALSASATVGGRMSGHPEVTREPFTGVQIRIGVMGSASEPLEPAVAVLGRGLGRAIADRGCCLLTGACPGLPHEAVLGAKDGGGHVVGISPASSLREHVEVFRLPYREYDVLIFTGLGLMGRELVNIRSSDIVVVMGGRSGTLGEFAIAYEEGKLIGVLTGTGGITDALRAVETSLRKATGAEVLYDAQPLQLVDRLLDRYTSQDYVCPCRPAGGKAERG